ncbi:Ectonucleotide pyrophosphatase/phosphodiesterase family member 3 [Larimichthys crocea]|uniref:Uncharacterized protein n=1 Tax=Larimichthys crocea TaxID=215358 RepID=A0ACD3RH93_LARCR|nr:Ectonucleotide pyrophosphatase/phosphodiesterase family member 3 [Larimichthys crocea]
MGWKKKITIGVLAVSIVTLILGLGLGLGLDKDPDPPQTSCRNRCFEPYDGDVPGCKCDVNCKATNSCCYDYHDICTVPKILRLTKVNADKEDLQPRRARCGFSPMTPRLIRKQYEESSITPTPMLVSPTSINPLQAGLYPESNGLIDNVMYDPVFDASFSLSNSEKNNPAWYLGQPIWHTARYQGLKSGTFFWPGSDVKINGSYPNIYEPYNGKVPFEERVFTVLKWLQLPDNERPDFYTLYLEEPDKSGHSYGPVSGGLIKAIQGVDNIMGQLMNGLKQIGLHRCLNIIILADHGMEETSCDRKEVLQNLVGDISNFWVTEGPFGRIRAKNKDTVLDSAGLVANMTCKTADQKIKPYLKANLPKRLHFANSRRIEDVNVLVDLKWLFERYPGSLTFCSGGAHGYDNDAESMHAMFLSYGPKFQSKTEIEPFSNVELYNLMCDVLQIAPTDNNGTHGSMNHMLRQPFYEPAPPAEQSTPVKCPLVSLDPADTLGCSCTALGGNDINNRLNLTADEESAAEKKHTPFGRPRMLQPNQSYCVLHQEGFINAYSHKALMPLWSSFTIDKPMDSDPLDPVMQDCLRPDVRLTPSQSPTCDQYNNAGNLTHAFLYPPSTHHHPSHTLSHPALNLLTDWKTHLGRDLH